MSDVKVLVAQGGCTTAVFTCRTQEARMSCESSGRGLARTCRAAEDLSPQAFGAGRQLQAPVRVMQHERVVGVMVSPEDHEAMRAFYADRLVRTMDRTAHHAEQAGLTPERLDTLLADES